VRLHVGLTFACLCLGGNDLRAQPTQTLFHVTHNTYGCVNPRATPAITNLADPRQRDPGWVHFVITDGQCAPITPKSPWRLVFRQGALAYMTYAGTTGVPGSYYLKFNELVEFQPLPDATLQPSVPSASDQSLNGAPMGTVSPLATSEPTPTNQPSSPTQTYIPPAARLPNVGPSMATSGYIDPPEARVRAPLPALTNPAPYSSPQPAAVASDLPPAQRQGSSGGAVVFTLIILGILGLLLKKRQKSVGRQTKSEPQMRVPPRPVSPAVSAQAAPASSPRGNTPVTWYPKGSPVTVAGQIIRDGLIHVGAQHPSAPGGSPCFIDPNLPVARSSPDTAGAEMSYWPSYGQISPRSRLAYLQWLSNGKSDPSAYIGFVFLYFYGLERRVFLVGTDANETVTIIGEVERLRRIYGSNRSFDGYSRGFLEASEIKRLLGMASASRGYSPDLGAPAYVMPMMLKLAIATRVTKGEPLSFELAVAGLVGLPQGTSIVDRRVLEHAWPYLIEMLRPRFEAVCPLGLRLRPGKAGKLPLIYRGATAGLQVDLGAAHSGASLPDPAMLDWSKLIALVAPVAADLEPFAKRAAHRSTWAASLEAVAFLPTEVQRIATIGPAQTASRWLRTLPSPIAEVTFREISQHVLGESGAAWTARRQEKAIAALAALSYGVEPSPVTGVAPASIQTMMVLFPDVNPKLPGSPNFPAALISAEIVSVVARLDPVAQTNAENFWVEAITGRLSLRPVERLRLLARLRWLASTNANISRIRRFFAATAPGERETIGWSAATTAGALGAVTPDQVAMLEKIYDGLGLQRHDLYGALHSGAMGSASPAPTMENPAAASIDAPAEAKDSTRANDLGSNAGTPAVGLHTGSNSPAQPSLEPIQPEDGPVLVASGTGEVVHRIPAAPHLVGQSEQSPSIYIQPDGTERPEDVAPLIVKQDVSPNAQEKEVSTEQKAAVTPASLQPNLLDEERVRQIRAETERVMSVLQSVFQEEEDEPAAPTPPGEQGRFTGLDTLHTELVDFLALQLEVPRPEFDRKAIAGGLLPDGALETINEWAYDHLGDALIEDGDPLTINVELLSSFQGIADAA
jgi:hypothetical protein